MKYFQIHQFPKRDNTLMFFWFVAAILLLFSSAAFAHGMSEEEKQAVIAGGNLRYMWLGATHMLSGYDHLAFVFGIIFFLTTFRDIAKYVTAFTVGHSITLIFATFNAIQLNYFLIDAIIGLSVSYIAFANLDGFRKYFNVNPPNMMFMIVTLGLIHGFGLSTRLQELPLSEDQLLLNIISFNVGIELGQISALAIMLLLIAAWRKSHFFQTFSSITNTSLVVVGAYLFLMQMHGYEHATNEELRGGAAVAATVEPVDQNQLTWSDTIEVLIPARGDKEYKLYLTQGATFSYAWQTDGKDLFFDFHGEPAADSTGSFQSFQKNTLNKSTGTLTASFEGTHGWYWKNNSNKAVTVTLKVSGDYARLDADKAGADAETYVHDSL
ncbi:MAG: HupE/UreJ family protein [Gammaproteobacteria bacterium]|nr:HupE/UreJ family protein [Gammaproteobacteria bacterium]MDH5803151.1 HupE/UreJ family protein [Gammaproteobacteria bacterium]